MTDIAARSAPLAARRRHSRTASTVNALVTTCAIVPYALVGLWLRFVMARLFFLEGQAKIDGPILHFNMRGLEASVVLPTQIKHSTMEMFETLYANLPIPPSATTHIFAYAEFLLPICLILGFATRLSALVLLILTVLTAVYVTPGEFWTTQVYWISILVVLLSVGPGGISIDALIRYLYRREKPPEFR
jgi:putative oxidoreductase